jgi:hypothetical protein
MPREEFEAISWTRNPGWYLFRGDIERIVFDMMSCTGIGDLKTEICE